VTRVNLDQQRPDSSASLRPGQDQSSRGDSNSRQQQQQQRTAVGEAQITNDDRRSFKDDRRSFKDDRRSFKDDRRGFKDERRDLIDERRPFRDDRRSFRDDREDSRRVLIDDRRFLRERPRSTGRFDDDDDLPRPTLPPNPILQCDRICDYLIFEVYQLMGGRACGC